MSQSQLTVLERAKHGDTEAIAALMNRSLQPRGITARVVREGGNLQVHVESQQPPHQVALVEFTRKGVMGLNIPGIHTVHLYGMQQGRPIPIWEETLHLQEPPVMPAIDVPPVSTATTDLDPEDTPDLEEGTATPADDTDGEIVLTAEVPESKGGMITWLTKNWLLIPVMAILAIVGFLAVVFVWKQVTQSPTSTADSSPIPPNAAEATTSPPTPTSASPAPAAAPAATPPAEVSPSQPANLPPSQATLNQAYDLGMSAAIKTQTAATQAEWNQVVADWQQALQRLESIPTDDPNAATAQQKIQEYQRNLTYAQERLAIATP